MDIRTLLNEARLTAAAGGVLGPMTTGMLADEVTIIVRENRELRDRIWALERAAHAHDEMEPEDG